MATTYAESKVAKTPCLICAKGNPPDAYLCAECGAPMALVHETVGQNREPSIISVIGESNVGKTVYLGFLLDMLSQRAGDFEAIPKGAFSVDLQQNVVNHMAQRCFPPKTPMETNQWYWAYYQICRTGRQKRWHDLVMPDMAGESLAAEVESPNTFSAIRSLLAKSNGLILLIDAALAGNGSSQPDFFALKILSYIDSMFKDSKSRKKQRVKTPTAIVLCKSDYCPECFDNPPRFVEANLNRLWNLCQNRFDNVSFFSCSVVGSLGFATSPEHPDYVIPIPLHTSLRGVLEPFEWIIDRL